MVYTNHTARTIQQQYCCSGPPLTGKDARLPLLPFRAVGALLHLGFADLRMACFEVVPHAFRPSASDTFADITSDVLHHEAAGHLAFWNLVHRGKRSFDHALHVLAILGGWRELSDMLPNP